MVIYLFMNVIYDMNCQRLSVHTFFPLLSPVFAFMVSY